METHGNPRDREEGTFDRTEMHLILLFNSRNHLFKFFCDPCDNCFATVALLEAAMVK